MILNRSLWSCKTYSKNLFINVLFVVSAAQRDRIRRQQRAEIERQMKEIAAREGATTEQMNEAMKLAKNVLEQKDAESNETEELAEEELE